MGNRNLPYRKPVGASICWLSVSVFCSLASKSDNRRRRMKYWEKMQEWVTQQHITETKRGKDKAVVWQIMHVNVTSIKWICIVFHRLKQTWGPCQQAGMPDGMNVSIIVRRAWMCVNTYPYTCVFVCIYIYLCYCDYSMNVAVYEG